MKQEQHMLHQSEIIKISNCYEHMKSFLNEQMKKLNNNFLEDENWIYLQNFDNFFSDFKNKIERNYDNILNVLEDMKASEIDFLIYFKEKVKIEEKISDINNSVEVLINEFLSFDENDKNIQHIINYRKNVLKNYEAVLNQHNILKQYYKCFTEATKEIEIFNENMISRIEEKLNVAKQLFNVENIKKSLANISLSK